MRRDQCWHWWRQRHNWWPDLRSRPDKLRKHCLDCCEAMVRRDSEEALSKEKAGTGVTEEDDTQTSNREE